MTPRTVEAPHQYVYKASRYSSHTFLLKQIPEAGNGRRVLDIGCAAGYLSEILVGRGYSVTAIDLYGDEGPAGAEFLTADLNAGLPALRGQFDYIICADVLEHLTDPLVLLRDIAKYLAPGGVLLASLPNSGHAYFRLTVMMGRFPQHDRGLFDRTHLHFYTWLGWVDLLERAGFSIRSVDCSAVPFELVFPRAEGIALILDMLSHFAARLWKKLFAYQFIVTAGRNV